VPLNLGIKDIKLWKELADDRIKIKAAGGIRNYQTAVEMIKAGAERIGTSHGVDIVKGR